MSELTRIRPHRRLCLLARMRIGRRALLVVALGLTMVGHAGAQQSGPWSAQSWQFQSWQPAFAIESGQEPVLDGMTAASKNRKQHALVGGIIGAGAGVVFSAVMCEAADDPGDTGASFCSAGRFLLSAGAGFAVGALIGWVI